MINGRRRVIAVIAAIALLAVAGLGVVGYYIKSRLDTITLTAQFDSAAGLYEGNAVAVLGMPVGTVSKITSKGSYVEVEFTVDKHVKIPAAAQAVTITTSILTARQIELTPPYRGGPVLKNHDTIGLTRTKTPVAFDRLLDMLDKVSKSLKGNGAGGGPIADLTDAAVGISDGNGQKILAALDELSKALRLSSERGETTRDELTTIVTDLSSLVEAAARNDAKVRQFGSTTHQLSQMLADEGFGTGATGRTINKILDQVASLIEANRENLKQAIRNGDTAAKSVVDNQRGVAEMLDVLPLTLENLYNTVDQNNGAIRVHGLLDKALTDSQSAKEICNLMHLRQLGCSTGTLQDYGPDFGLTYILDGLSAMGQ
ncbi:MCE family protein [Mycobacterium kyorinense]|uniref:Mammalian cell entry protein n=1 Tax=Mycobacterium kyorinense TaxID=487514 RepID=A0A1X1XQ54_9MYCO|nr:MCE family protein [Mycobacterium kyorinense]ORW00986.1 mammalian cell entry protein [Mycobacterium kyorinense]